MAHTTATHNRTIEVVSWGTVTATTLSHHHKTNQHEHQLQQAIYSIRNFHSEQSYPAYVTINNPIYRQQ